MPWTLPFLIQIWKSGCPLVAEAKFPLYFVWNWWSKAIGQCTHFHISFIDQGRHPFTLFSFVWLTPFIIWPSIGHWKPGTPLVLAKERHTLGGQCVPVFLLHPHRIKHTRSLGPLDFALRPLRLCEGGCKIPLCYCDWKFQGFHPHTIWPPSVQILSVQNVPKICCS